MSRLLRNVRIGKDTSQIAIVDKWGNAVSITPSDFPKSPMVPGTGLTLGNRMTQFRLDPSNVDALAPGKRPRITPHAVIVFKDGKFSMAIGIRRRHADAGPRPGVPDMTVFGMGIQDAINAPRFRSKSAPDSFAPHESSPGTLLLEKKLYDADASGLTALGYTVKSLPDWDNTFGAVGAVLKNANGLNAARIRGKRPGQRADRLSRRREFMETVSWEDFLKVELRVGMIIAARAFPEARKPPMCSKSTLGKR